MSVCFNKLFLNFNFNLNLKLNLQWTGRNWVILTCKADDLKTWQTNCPPWSWENCASEYQRFYGHISNLWVHHKNCSGLKTLSKDMSYECPRCRGEPGVHPIDGRPFKEVEVGDSVLEAVDRFCYLGDILSAGVGCMAAATARCKCAWGKFRENLPLLTSKPVPFDLRGRLFSSNVRSSMLHGMETWPMTSTALHRLRCNTHAMIRWICGA